MFRLLTLVTLILCWFSSVAQTCSVVSSDIVCKEELMSFDITASGGISSMAWDMGDGNTSAQKSFSHKYSVAGTKTVKVIVKLNGGGSCTAIKQITVYELPQFKSRLKPDNIYCLSQNRVCFIDSSAGGDIGINLKKRIVLWDDGNQTTTPNPAIGNEVCHTYSKIGTYKITIELTNDKDCKAKKEFSITILPDVIPKLGFSSLPGCDSSLAIFEDLTKKDTSEIVGRIYDWGDGNKLSNAAKTADHFYKNPGNYKVTLTLVQKNGCRTSKDTVVTIFIKQIKFNIYKDAYKKCYGDDFRFEQHDSLKDAYYLWKIGPLGIEGKTIEVKPELGKNLVQLTINYGGCFKTFKYDSIEVVGIKPTLTILNTVQCQNRDTVYFCERDIRYGTKRVSFLWDFGDDAASKCTTSYKNNANVKSNCNYSTDSIGKHLYVNGICRTWKLTIIDRDNGCNIEREGVVNIKKPDKIQFSYTVDRKCRGNKYDYAVNFSSSLCSATEIKVNFDSACGRNGFGYFSPVNTYSKTCNKDGWVTVGFSVKHGNKKVYRTICDTTDYYIDPSRECFDTIWYHNWFQLMTEPLANFNIKGKCINSEIQPVIKDSIQKNISFTFWKWGDDSKVDTVFMLPGDTSIKPPKHRYKKSGIYNVTFYIENKNRCYEIYNKPVMVGFESSIDFDSIICPGEEVIFKEKLNYLYDGTDYWHNAQRKQDNKENFKWNFDDGRGFMNDTAMPKIKFSISGIYNIRLAAKDSSNCMDTVSKKLFIGGVKAGIKAITKKIICNDILQFFDSSSVDFVADRIIKYYWEFGDQRNPSYLVDPYHYYKSYGQFIIFHRVENTMGCKDSAYITIKIEGPEPKFDIISDTVGCVPFTGVFKNTSIKAKDYIWYFGDSAKSVLSTTQDTNVKFTYTKPGIYYIYLFGSDSVVNPNTGNSIHFCSTTFPDTSSLKPAIRRVVVLPIPKADFIVDSVLCAGQPLLVTDNSDSIYTRYKWVIYNKDSLETTDKSASLDVNDTGNYTIKYTPFYTPKGPYQRYCFDTTSKVVKVTQVIAALDYVKDNLCPVYTFTNKSKGYSAIKWDLGHAASGDENNIRYENSVTHNYLPDTGTFYPCLFVESKYGCRDTVCAEFKISFTIKAIFSNVFTPDNDDNLNDAFDIVLENAEEYNLSIYNRWGQLVYFSDKDGIRNDGINWTGKAINTGLNCPEGTYFYLFKYKFKCEDKKREAHGTVTLIRD
jgi:gliding motility-associated-like protein